MKKLLVYLKEYKTESVLGPLFKLLEALIDLMVPLIMAGIIDRGIANREEDFIIRMCFLLILVGIIGLALSVLGQYFSAKASVGFVKRVKQKLYSHIQGLSFSDIDKMGADTLITRLTSDMNQIQTGVNLSLRLLLRSPFIVTGACILAFTIDARIGGIVALTILTLSVVIFGIMFWTIPRYKSVQKALDKLLGKIRENLTGVRVIRAFCKEEEEKAEFYEQNLFLTNLSRRVARVSALMNPLTFVIVNLGIVLLLYTGGERVYEGSLTRGQIVALYNYMAQILIELVKFANMFINITKSVACGDRVQAILNYVPSMKDGTRKEARQDYPLMIEFKNVGLNYNGPLSVIEEENALNNLSFSVHRGETLGIIGGTGSGKTSLVNLISRFYEASTGEVLVDGVSVTEWNLAALRKKIGVVLQKAALFKGTIRENLLIGKEDATDEEMLEAIKAAMAEDIIKKKEEGLDHLILQNGRNLSGGQKQRLSIARALVKKPEILILDDSSSALDYVTDAALRENIGNLSYRPTVLLVSQRTVSVMKADKILVLNEGKIVGKGTHEELLQTCQVYKEIYESQFKTTKGDRNEK